ncbi:glyoxalase [Candidatus Peregrinibacteria bacterium RIFOXYA12_FULL_33_12]|nr:MAG: glyoxalase [Candidatus Peregrinibacteria bacterium RIFOXYA12_FULL_33_12]
MHPVIHFEMPAEDRKRMSDFYTQVFGWQTNQLGPEMGDYVLVMTTESDKKGPKKAGTINGGFFQKTKDMPSQYPSVVIQVDDIKKHLKEVEKAGGKVTDKPIKIPNVGSYISFYDTEGNRISMLQPIQSSNY